MKNNVRMFLLGALALLASVNVQAQEAPSLGINHIFLGVGGTLSKQTDQKMGFGELVEAGVEVRLPIADVVLLPSLRLSNRRTKSTQDYGNIGTALGTWTGKYEGTLKTYYIDLPIRVAYKTSLGKGTLVPFVGPYLSYGVSGTLDMKLETGTPGGTTKTSETSSDYFGDTTKRFDYGLSVGAAYQMAETVYLQLEYDMGLKKPNANLDRKWSVISLTLGCNL